MQYSISLLNRAKFEPADSVDWYNVQRKGLGSAFARAVQRKLATIQLYPERHPYIYEKFRQVSLDKFPYCIIYFIEKKSEIVVYSIFHHNRNPESKFR